MLLGMARGFIVPVVPIMAKDVYSVGASAAILAFVVQQTGSVLSTFPTGYIIDHLGRRATLIGAPLIGTVSGALIFFAAHTYLEFLIYIALGGVAQQMWQMSRLAAIADSVKSSSRGRFITSMAGTQRVGTLLGPILGGLLGQFVSPQAPFLAYAIVSALAAVPAYYLIKETAPQLLAKKSGQKAADIDTRWRTLITKPVMILFGAQYFANVGRGGAQGQGGFYFVVLSYSYGLGAAALGGITTGAGIAGIPIMLVSGQIMDRFGRKRQIVPASGMLGVGVLMMAFTTLFQMPLGMFLTAYVWIQIAISMMAGTMQTLGADVAPAAARGKFFGANRFVAESGTLTNPSSAGLFVAFLGEGAIGYSVPFFMWSASAFTCALLIGLLLKETLDKDDVPERAPT